MPKIETRTAETKEIIVQPRQIRVGVMGPMGSGKSTFMLGFRDGCPRAIFIDEVFESNIYLADQYKSREGAAFKSQIWQLGLKINQLKEIKSDRLSLFVPLLEDKSYAEGYLSGDDLETYFLLYNLFVESGMAPSPDVILKLVIEDDALVQRVKERDRDFERNVDPRFLMKLNQIMTKNCEESGIPIIPIDSQYQDFRNLGKMAEIVAGVEYQIYEKLKDKFKDSSSGLLLPSFMGKGKIL